MWSSLSAFYTSREWAEFRRMYILSHGLRCAYCGELIGNSFEAILHHIDPLTEENVNDYSISLSEDNCQLVHHKCHNIIHERFGTFNRHIYLVYGAPGSGKSTFVMESAGRHDLIVDMDKLYTAVSINSLYDKPGTLSGAVFSLRDCLLDMIRVRSGKWHNAYIIGGYPRLGERERLCQIYGAEEIYIPADREECIARCVDRPGWSEYIDRWFAEYTPPPDC